MNGRFITHGDIVRETFDWGESGWISRPSLTGSTALCVMDVTLTPGSGHNFHRHPDQEEVIWVREGRVEQWLEHDSLELGPGDAVYIPRDVVHASFTVGDTDAKLSVILSPTAGDDGYSVIDVFEEEPWTSLRRSRSGASPG
jgi:quercetin dioxygenase-like cupin family protein